MNTLRPISTSILTYFLLDFNRSANYISSLAKMRKSPHFFTDPYRGSFRNKIFRFLKDVAPIPLECNEGTIQRVVEQNGIIVLGYHPFRLRSYCLRVEAFST